MSTVGVVYEIICEVGWGRGADREGERENAVCKTMQTKDQEVMKCY